MPKPSAPPSKFNWKLIFFIVVVGGIAYVVTSPQDATTSPKPITAASKSSSGPADAYLKEDYDAHFADLAVEPKNAFLPLVSKLTVGGAVNPFAISDKLTGGGDWMYTGMVQVNGKPQALLEEQKTAESVFLNLGEHWKKARVKRITNSDLELVGDDGTTAIVKMGDSTAPAKSPEPSGLAPVGINPPAPLQGNINPNQLDMTPLPGVQPIQPAPARRGRGRGRRGRNNNADNGGQNGS
ncbi:MAG TPA: hypothetical protein VG944_01730 [Fimbriimonas sp.]|nr:hypothetical protein [Fimbriimonas sp.]